MIAVVAVIGNALVHPVSHSLNAGLPDLLRCEEAHLVPDALLKLVQSGGLWPTVLVHSHPSLELRIQP